MTITHYISLLKDYNESINIFSKKAYDHLDFHVEDSQNIAQLIGNTNQTVMDMGSGGGFPSVIVAIQNPLNHVIAVESKQKKANFLKIVQKELALKNYMVLNEDILSVMKQKQAKTYTAKAFKPYPEVINLIKKKAPSHSRLIIPLSQAQFQEIKKETPAGINTKDLELIQMKEFYYLIYKT